MVLHANALQLRTEIGLFDGNASEKPKAKAFPLSLRVEEGVGGTSNLSDALEPAGSLHMRPFRNGSREDHLLR
jgi:hypothetical protein